MISRRLALSQKTRRALLGWGVIVALAFHGLIPLGYMPDLARKADQPLAMTICGGMNMSSMAMGDEHRHDDNAPAKNDDGGKAQNHPPCPFSVNSVFAFDGIVPDTAMPVYLFIAVAAFSAFAFAAPRRFGNAAPRAPPLSA